jgi:MFS family permease
MVFNSSRIVAPAIAAWCLTFMSPIGVLVLAGLAFLTAALLNLLLDEHASPPGRRASSRPTNGWQDFTAGVRFSWSDPAIRLLCTLTLINSQVARSLMELLPALSGLFTAGTATDLATLTAFAGGGSILGGWYMSTLGRDTRRLVRVLIGAMFFTALAIAPLLFPLSIWPMSIFIGLISLLMTLLGTGSQILLQRQTEDSMRGRVLSLWITLAIAGAALGALIMGAIAEFLGFPVLLSLMLLLSLLSTAWLSRRGSLIYDRALPADPLTTTLQTQP